MSNHARIILMGYMGSGKSYFGKALAQHLNLNFIDIDKHIEQREKLSISNLFEQKGEVYFRKVETRYLQEVLNDYQYDIIALGGGTPCYGVNLEIIKSTDNMQTVYLQKSVLELSKTLYNEKSTRPMIAHFSNEEDFIEYISKHLFERQYYYLQAAHKINLSNVDSNEDVIEKLKHILKNESNEQ